MQFQVGIHGGHNAGYLGAVRFNQFGDPVGIVVGGGNGQAAAGMKVVLDIYEEKSGDLIGHDVAGGNGMRVLKKFDYCVQRSVTVLIVIFRLSIFDDIALYPGSFSVVRLTDRDHLTQIKSEKNL